MKTGKWNENTNLLYFRHSVYSVRRRKLLFSRISCSSLLVCPLDTGIFPSLLHPPSPSSLKEGENEVGVSFNGAKGGRKGGDLYHFSPFRSLPFPLSWAKRRLQPGPLPKKGEGQIGSSSRAALFLPLSLRACLPNLCLSLSLTPSEWRGEEIKGKGIPPPKGVTENRPSLLLRYICSSSNRMFPLLPLGKSEYFCALFKRACVGNDVAPVRAPMDNKFMLLSHFVRTVARTQYAAVFEAGTMHHFCHSHIFFASICLCGKSRPHLITLFFPTLLLVPPPPFPVYLRCQPRREGRRTEEKAKQD